MATPTWVGFDVRGGTRVQLLGAGHRVMRDHGFSLFRVCDLVSGSDGIEVGDIEKPSSSFEEALALAHEWVGAVLSYEAAPLGGNMHTYSWREQGGDGFGLEIPHKATVYGEPEGFWLQEFLCELSGELGARLCVYSADQPVLETPKLEDVVQRLRRGNIFRFLLVARDALPPNRVAELHELTRPSNMTYFPIGEDFHAWSRLVSL
jgi:hypothetical protein